MIEVSRTDAEALSHTVPRVLIVDDDRDTCSFMTELLAQPDREVVSAHEPEEALRLIRTQRFDLIVSDINLNAQSTGLDLLREFKSLQPGGQVVLISGFGTLETAIEAVRAGAFDYVSKPFNITAIKETVDRALAQAALPDAAPMPVRTRHAPEGLLGRSAAMLDVYKQIARAADSSAPVLIQGESGTGKELVARAIHEHGRRASRPFVAVNCGAIVDTLLDTELFGHTRGSFTGAVSDRRGLFEQAGDGTIFLDEIGETTPALQVKLLRVLEESEVRPVGAARVVNVSARVVAATNVDLEKEVAAGRFRQDLFYRLSVVVIVVPPLRERRSDIPLLINRFLDGACARAGRRVDISPEAIQAMSAYSWPGNVRELENTVERLVLFSRASVIEAEDLPAPLRSRGPGLEEGLFLDLPSLDELERRYLVHVLKAVDGNRSRAAAVMGVDRRTLYRMAERFGVQLKDEGKED
jgi:DNA-binding NtrC family response regulator